MSIIIVGIGEETHVGAHLMNGLAALDREACLLDMRAAGNPAPLLRALSWKLWRSPGSLRRFSRSVCNHCRDAKPKLLLSTGIAPIDCGSLRAIGALGVRRAVFLTDDPWNPNFGSRWFLQALTEYDDIFTPRRSNLDELRRLGKASVHYLPFAYSPGIHYPAYPLEMAPPNDGPDIGFVGGGDPGRVAVMSALNDAGFRIALHGHEWERFPATKAIAQGLAGPERTRSLARLAKVSIGLVRKLNRDGHCMRTFELPAMGACVLAEDTSEHREIYGEEGDAVLYFRDIPELIRQVRVLIANPELRQTLRVRCHRRIVAGANRYADRMQTLLDVVSRA